MLARAIAESGRTVILVDLTGSACPTRLMAEHDRLAGITDLLCGETAFGDAIHRDRLSDAHIVPQGVSDPARAMRAADRLTMIIDALSDAYDLVLIECGPADTTSLGRLVRGESAEVILSVPGFGEQASWSSPMPMPVSPTCWSWRRPMTASRRRRAVAARPDIRSILPAAMAGAPALRHRVEPVVALDDGFCPCHGKVLPGEQQTLEADRQQDIVLHRLLAAPAALVGLVSDAEVEQAGARLYTVFDRQPEQKLAGAGIRTDALVDRAELAKHVAALA
jgi:hypothetical protein